MPEPINDCFELNSDRRAFLRTGGCFALALAAFGFPMVLSGVPVTEISGSGSANEKRYPIPAADSVNIDHSAQVILVRYQNNIYAFSLACPHEHAAIKWVQKERRFQCTKHDSKYQPNGAYTSGRATRNLDRFVVRKEDAFVVVDLQHWFESDRNSSGWTSAFVAA